jgi:hypothetical protein
MTDREVLARIIGDSASLVDVEKAFTGELDDPQHARYRWTANVSLDGEIIGIAGEISHDETAIGRFARRLYYEHGAARAAHDILVRSSGRPSDSIWKRPDTMHACCPCFAERASILSLPRGRSWRFESST